MTAEEAAVLLREVWGPGIEDVTAATNGEVSRVFFFRQRSRNYVARFQRQPGAFDLDALAGRAFSGSLPVPAVRSSGRVGTLWYAISDRLPGQPLQATPWPWRESVTEGVLDLLEGLRALDIAASSGYGPVGAEGNAPRRSQEDYLAGLFGEESTGFWAGWRELFDTSCLERGVFDRLHDRLRALIPFCGCERRVVHGDFHVGNILTDGCGVTGLIDWSNMRYGDPLYDLAVFHFWTGRVALPERYAARLAHPEPNYRERLLCHTLCVGLDALRFYAKFDRREAYVAVRDKLMAQVDSATR